MIVYVFGFMVPVCFSMIIKAFGGAIRVLQVVTIYGYSQAINVPTLLLCAFPNAAFQNFAIVYGGLHSSVFVFLCLQNNLV